ncbi:UbiA prenyltransferase family protein [Dactylosporangium salmoneum]|uniref:Decaprenyl-phosphate phosphoribosyltransferase n=1 Tax=Dactylosporangium salmoneum TaxID=53361 RepID=A0ABN3GD92_9ACTN
MSAEGVVELPAPVPVAVRPAGWQLLRLARPRQWAKNLLAVPLALADAGGWGWPVLARAGWAVAVFTCAAVLVYVGNDISDRRADRLHPVKRHRPIAAGRVSVPLAVSFAAAVAALLAALLLFGPAVPPWPVAGYLLLNVAYSRWLKHAAPLDVCVVALGFVLRVWYGYDAVGAAVSLPLLGAVFTGCLVLVLGKRRHELGAGGPAHRPALAGYTLQLTDQLLGLSLALSAGAFLLYLATDAPVGHYRQAVLLVAAPAGLFAAFRYLQAIHVHRAGGDPVRAVLHDGPIVASAALVGVVLAAAIALNHYPHLVHWMGP